jgi:Fe-Mn family superoxide dismutase
MIKIGLYIAIWVASISHFNLYSDEQQNKSMLYQQKDFTYLLGHVKGFNDGLLSLHIQLYEGYVKNVNQLRQELQDIKTQGMEKGLAFGALQRRLGWEYDGMRLHELYFEEMGEGKDLSTNSFLYKHIEKDFGSFEAWKKDFIATGLMRGIGWVILYQDVEGHLMNIWINEHDVGHLVGGKPLLVMDVWEHAYLTQYALDRNQYIQAFLEVIKWDIVNARY